MVEHSPDSTSPSRPRMLPNSGGSLVESAPATTGGATLLVSADLSTFSKESTAVSRVCHNASSPATHSSEVEYADQPAGPPTPLQANAVCCEPEQPASTWNPVSMILPPQAFNRRSTLADCSDITSPPNSAPAVAASSSTLLGKASGSGNTPRIPKPKREPTKTAKVKGRKKKELITPLEYARKLQAQLSELAAPSRKKQSDNPFLQGKRIFYYGGDLNYAGPQTRNRMEIVRQGCQLLNLICAADDLTCYRSPGMAGCSCQSTSRQK